MSCRKIPGAPDLPHQNRSSHVDYRQAYTPELATIAANRYERDIELFDYTMIWQKLLK